MSAPVAALREVYFSYGNREVIRGVSLTVKEGEIVAIVGPNGAGKSTLLKLLAGTLLPSRGEVFLEGERLKDLSRRKIAQKIAVVPQDASISFPFRVLEVVLFGRFPHQGGLAFASEQDLACAREALSQVGALAYAERPVLTLSGGERQRVLLARALAQKPRLLLLDEPTAHLDLAHQAQALQAVEARVRAEKIAAVVILHDLNLAALYATRLVLVAQGSVAREGQAREIFAQTLLESVYGKSIDVLTHPERATPVILPRKAPRPASLPEE